ERSCGVARWAWMGTARGGFSVAYPPPQPRRHPGHVEKAEEPSDADRLHAGGVQGQEHVEHVVSAVGSGYHACLRFCTWPAAVLQTAAGVFVWTPGRKPQIAASTGFDASNGQSGRIWTQTGESLASKCVQNTART